MNIERTIRNVVKDLDGTLNDRINQRFAEPGRRVHHQSPDSHIEKRDVSGLSTDDAAIRHTRLAVVAEVTCRNDF